MDTLSPSDAFRWLFAQQRGGLPRDPARMRALITSLGLVMPPSSVHVVGTNGKGTVASIVAAGFQVAGRRVGLFTSPHVERFNERIRVDGDEIDDEIVVEFVDRVRRIALSPFPAFFELSFALALEHFARLEVDMAVIEAGVGARHDATITLAGVCAVAITTIALDHLDTLGPSLHDIARDKAEAIRPGIPVLSAHPGAVREVIAGVASARQSPLFFDHAGSRLFSLPAPFDAATEPRGSNSRLAAATLRLLGVPEPAVIAGLGVPPLPGRGERFRLGGTTVLLDGAHDRHAASVLRRALVTPYVLVFGALARKQGKAMLEVLAPDALATVITRAQEGEPLPAVGGFEVIDDPIDALRRALALCPPDGCVLVTGSLYLAGRVRPFLRAPFQHASFQRAHDA